MDAAAIIARLKAMEPELRSDGLEALYLFGSRARGEERSDSDIDLTFDVSHEAESRFNLWDQAGLLAKLTDALQAEVDLVERKAFRPNIRQRIEPELMKIF